MTNDMNEIGGVLKVIFDLLATNEIISKDQNVRIKYRLSAGAIKGTTVDIKNILGISEDKEGC
jgi:hypothetical protein